MKKEIEILFLFLHSPILVERMSIECSKFISGVTTDNLVFSGKTLNEYMLILIQSGLIHSLTCQIGQFLISNFNLLQLGLFWKTVFLAFFQCFPRTLMYVLKYLGKKLFQNINSQSRVYKFEFLGLFKIIL